MSAAYIQDAVDEGSGAVSPWQPDGASPEWLPLLTPWFIAFYLHERNRVLFTKKLYNPVSFLEGEFPNKQLKLLLAWIAIHEDELNANWKMLSNGEGYFKIEPLK